METHNQPSPDSYPLRSLFRAGPLPLLLLGAVLLRIALIAAIVLRVIEVGQSVGWQFYHGGDERQLADLAVSLLQNDPIASPLNIAQPLWLAFWFRVLGVYDYWTALTPLVITNALILGPLSVGLVGALTWTAFRDRAAVVLAASGWALTPLLGVYGFFWHPSGDLLRDTSVPRLAWLNGLADGPAAFFLLLGVLLVLLGTKKRPASWDWLAFFSGLVLGFAVIFRIHMVFAAGFLFLYTAVVRGWRPAAVMFGGLTAGYLPQAWYNQVVFHFPVWSGYYSLQTARTRHFTWAFVVEVMPFSIGALFNNVFSLIQSRAWLVIPALLGLAFAGLVLWMLSRYSDWKTAVLLLVTPVVYLLPLMLTTFFREDMVRFIMPALPLLAVPGAFAFILGWRQAIGRLRPQPIDSTSSGR